MKIETIESKLTLISGLHIGASEDSMSIGGVDSPVLKREVLSNCDGKIGFGVNFDNKVKEPYIAGSSLKGKVRSLLEHYFRLIDPMGNGNVVDSTSNFGDSKKRQLLIELFGESSGETKNSNITRAIFRDCYITEDVRAASIANKLELFEEKAENVIDRVTGTTKKGGLRHIERVPSSIEFDFDISLRVFKYENNDEKSDNEALLKDTLKLGLKLLELDTLGGSGSRGYGKVKFNDLPETIESLSTRVENALK